MGHAAAHQCSPCREAAVTRKASFKQDDVARAVRGCTVAGMVVGGVRISLDGSIEVLSLEAAGAPSKNPLDRLHR